MRLYIFSYSTLNRDKRKHFDMLTVDEEKFKERKERASQKWNYILWDYAFASECFKAYYFLFCFASGMWRNFIIFFTFTFYRAYNFSREELVSDTLSSAFQTWNIECWVEKRKVIIEEKIDCTECKYNYK